MLAPTAACYHILQSSSSNQALTRRSIWCRWAALAARLLRSCWAVMTSTLSSTMAMRHLLAVMDELFTKHSTLADCRVMQSALLNTSAGCSAQEGLSQQCKSSVRAISAVGGRAALATQVLSAVQTLTPTQVPQLIGIDSLPDSKQSSQAQQHQYQLCFGSDQTEHVVCADSRAKEGIYINIEANCWLYAACCLSSKHAETQHSTNSMLFIHQIS